MTQTRDQGGVGSGTGVLPAPESVEPGAVVRIVEYTDPACPFAYSAEPHRRRLEWLYGDQLAFEVRMVGLAQTREEYAQKGLTPEMLAAGAEQLASRWGMPIDTSPREAVAATIPACRAVVAVRTHHGPAAAELLLRELRVLALSTGRLLDDPAEIADAAARVGVDRSDLDRWVASPETEQALQADLTAARRPSDAALALRGKLAKWGEGQEGGWRYTCPSYELQSTDGRLSVPGMQSSLTYEVAVANLAPGLERREPPTDPGEVLAWAPFPLSTQEVAEVMGAAREDARMLLQESGAHFTPAGTDGFWSSPSAPA